MKAKKPKTLCACPFIPNITNLAEKLTTTLYAKRPKIIISVIREYVLTANKHV